jgi:hypothetical protein
VGTPLGNACDTCSVKKTCADCAFEKGCGWDAGRKTCWRLNTQGVTGLVTNTSQCAASCLTYTSCGACTGAADCTWCESSGMCVPDSATVTEYAYGQCFRYSGVSRGCPTSCSVFECEDCLANARCGWCAEPGLLGRGVCEEGTVSGPGLFAPQTLSKCLGGPGIPTPSTSTTTTKSTTTTTFTGSTTSTIATPSTTTTSTTTYVVPPGNYSWHFFNCPDEDECLLSTHKCVGNSTCVNEDPRDVPGSRGYRCDCPQNYTLGEDGLTCEPLCDVFGCVSGRCTAPNMCVCNLGWTGLNCSEDCGCNGHSRCALQGPGSCDRCEENTYGARCEFCMEGFHGNATQGGSCLTCFETCNAHSNVCRSDGTGSAPVCANCTDNTMGSFCERCVPGFFQHPDLILAASKLRITVPQYIATTEALSQCVPCRCNGHGDTCNPDTGEECPCQDNTVTRQSECDLRLGSCYNSQCTSCISSMLYDNTELQVDGSPEAGQRCYTVPTSDVVLATRIRRDELHHYMVIPKFTNVDIRIYVDVDKFSAKALQMYVTSDRNLTQDAATKVLDFRSPPQWNVTVRQKQIVRVSSADFDFVSSRFYVTLVGVDEGELSYKFYFLQPVVTIDLFVFFAVFFSSFFLFLAAVIVVYRVKSGIDSRIQVQQEALQMQTMATRPMAKVNLLLGPPIINGLAAEMVAKAQSRGLLPSRPIATQPTR